MLNSKQLKQLYSRTSEATLNKWAASPECGTIFDRDFYDPTKLAITSGIQPALTLPLRKLLQEINELAQSDSFADAMPVSGLHFTFFAMSMPLYQQADIANLDPYLVSLFAKYAGQRTVTISNLQLVALPNQLLIAGTPDDASLQARMDFVRQLQDSPWRNTLLERHGNIPLPPPFWHSTLLRYRAQFLPLRFRQYFEDHQSFNYGGVSSPVSLVFTNYNWTEVHHCKC